MAVTSFTSPGIGQWLCPAGIFSVAVACWGAGGGGERGSTAGGKGAGGGEYAAEAVVAVTPGVIYQVIVGAGAAGRSGGLSSFIGDTLTVLAHGGRLGAAGGNGGTGSTNTVHHDGGNGGNGAVICGGGGGSSAGTTAVGGNGGNASAVSGGAGGTPPAGGGAGGAGATFYPLPGAPGLAPGGGGGGSTITGGSGGAGAHGQVEITYAAAVQPQIPIFPAGYKPANTDFDQWVQAPNTFLTSGKTLFRAELTTPLIMTGSVSEVIPFDSILEDPYAGWQSGPSQWLCPAGYPGMYAVSVTVSCAPSPSQPVITAQVGLDGSASVSTVDRAWVPPGGVPGIASGSSQVRLYGGLDSVQGLALCAGSSGTTVSTAGQRCRMSIAWISL